MILAALSLVTAVGLAPARAAPSTQAQVDELTLAQQVGQVLVLSFAGTTPPEYVRDALRERRVAGVILFGGNITSKGQLSELTRAPPAQRESSHRRGRPGRRSGSTTAVGATFHVGAGAVGRGHRARGG